MLKNLKVVISKLLYHGITAIKLILQRVLSEDIKDTLKKRLPRRAIEDQVYEIFIREWQTAREERPTGERSKSGVNLIGYLQVAKGIGEAARSNALALDSANIPYSLVDYNTGIPQYLKTEILPASVNSNQFVYNTNLIHVNPPQMPYLWGKYKKNDLIAPYTIGVWYWELPEFPGEWRFAFDLVDEVWVASRFVFDAVSARTSLPVKIIPPCINLTIDESADRSSFNLPSDCFLFLCAYDVLSTQARKNPMGAIEAFKRAFPQTETSVGLVIKVNNAQQNPKEIWNLRSQLEGYSNCYIIEEIFDRPKMNSLLNVIDVYISLHRSEGFGLIPAEAMYLGKPVVMTKWSGNVDFMTENNSCGVDYNLVPVSYNTGPYTTDQVWADPDIELATQYLQKLYTDKSFYNAIAHEAAITIRNMYSPQAIGNIILERLQKQGLM